MDRAHSSEKSAPCGALKSADFDRPASAEVAKNALAPPSTIIKRKRKASKAHLPWDTIADDDVNMVEGHPEDLLSACNAVRQASTTDTQNLGANAGFREVRII